MIESVLINRALIDGFETYLHGRGCYAKVTIRYKVNLAKRLGKHIENGTLPLDEDAAIAKIHEMALPNSRRRHELNTVARDLIEYHQKWRAGHLNPAEVPA